MFIQLMRSLAIASLTVGLYAMDSSNNTVPSLTQLTTDFIVEQIKKKAQSLNGKSITELTEIITNIWLTPELVTQDIIALIKNAVCSHATGISLCENSIQAFDKVEDPSIHFYEPIAEDFSFYESISVMLSLPNNNIVAGGHDGSLCIWNYKTNASIIKKNAHKLRIFALALLSNGNFVSVSKDDTISIWNPDTGECLNTLVGLDMNTVDTSIQVLPNGLIILCSSNHEIRIWDSEIGDCINVFKGHEYLINTITSLPDGNIASGSDDNTIRFWDQSGNCIKVLKDHQDMILLLKVLPNQTLLSSSRDNTLRIWDIQTGECLHILQVGTKIKKEYINDIAILKNNFIVVTFGDNTYIWDTNNGKVLNILKDHDKFVHSLAVISDNIIGLCAYNDDIRIWDAATDRYLLDTITIENGSITRLVLGSDGLIIVGTHNGALHAYRPGITFEEMLLKFSRQTATDSNKD